MGLAFGPLPVSWLDVSAVRENNTHIVSWSTAKEVNAAYYLVERRMENETEFKVIPGKVPANGNSNTISKYNLVDLDVDKFGIYIYKVKQVDLDGQFTYSKLVKVSNIGETIIDMYPNPAKSETTIEVVLPVDGEVRIELFDAASKLVKVIRKVSTQQSGNTLYNVNLVDVAAGVYNVIITIDGIATQKKLIRIE